MFYQHHRFYEKRYGTPELWAPPEKEKTYTYHFRLQGDFPPTANVLNAILYHNIDDGCAVYLNGVEVFRPNLSPGAKYADGTPYSVDEPYDREPLRCLIDHSLLRPGSGANVIAVEVHNHAPSDTDLRFDLKLGYFRDNWRTQ